MKKNSANRSRQIATFAGAAFIALAISSLSSRQASAGDFFFSLNTGSTQLGIGVGDGGSGLYLGSVPQPAPVVYERPAPMPPRYGAPMPSRHSAPIPPRRFAPMPPRYGAPSHAQLPPGAHSPIPGNRYAAPIPSPPRHEQGRNPVPTVMRGQAPRQSSGFLPAPTSRAPQPGGPRR